MTNGDRKDLEERAWDALIVACLQRSLDDVPDDDDLSILDQLDEVALAAMDDEFINRVLAMRRAGETGDSNIQLDVAKPVEYFGSGLDLSASLPTCDIAALHRGDDNLTPQALTEMDERASEVLHRTKARGFGDDDRRTAGD